MSSFRTIFISRKGEDERVHRDSSEKAHEFTAYILRIKREKLSHGGLGSISALVAP